MEKSMFCEFCEGKAEQRVIRARFHHKKQTLYIVSAENLFSLDMRAVACHSPTSGLGGSVALRRDFKKTGTLKKEVDK